MADYAFDIPERPAVPIAGSGKKFPIHRIYCIGRNYAEHIKEMSEKQEEDMPMFFQKPADAIVLTGGTMPYPGETENLHYEMELVAAIGKEGYKVSEDEALDLVFGYTVGMDMTRRDLQGLCKKRGWPWDIGKAVDFSAPISEIHTVADVGHPSKGRIELSVNGETRQDGDLEQMIWTIPQMISRLSTMWHLKPGDLIYTGTPAGVGAVKPGDKLTGSVEGVTGIEITIGDPE